MNTTQKTQAEAELAKVERELESLKVARIAKLTEQRQTALDEIAAQQRVLNGWRSVLAKIDSELSAASGESDHTYQAGKRRPSSAKVAAMNAVHDALWSRRGQRMASSDLLTYANGFKVRLLVAEWNDQQKAKKESRHLIKSEGDFKSRVYFID